MYQHLLFPIDGSPATQHALASVTALAASLKAQVTVLHAYQFPVLPTSIVNPLEATYSAEMGHLLQEAGNALLEQAATALQAQGVTVRTLLEAGEPRDLILEVAEREGCDLIIMGSRGLGTVRGFLLGSVSHYVVNHSHLPVMTIPHHAVEGS